MRVLITGGAGYVGSVSVRWLLDQGWDVTVVDSLERGHARAVDGRARLVVGDVGEPGVCDDALDGCAAVLHCAGYTDVAESVREPGMYHDNNLIRPLVLLDRMESMGVGTLVFSSTAAVYGEPEDVPIPEEASTKPVNPYGASKLAFERELEERVPRGLRSIRLRYFNAAGAWADGSLGESHDPETHIVPRILLGVLAGRTSFEVFGDDYATPDSTCIRDYMHVRDLAQAHELALRRLLSGGVGGVYNLGSGCGYSNRQVVSACSRVTGTDIEVVIGPRRAGDPAVLVASAERARADLGWEPEYAALDAMVADAWRWHTAHPEGYRDAS